MVIISSTNNLSFFIILDNFDWLNILNDLTGNYRLLSKSFLHINETKMLVKNINMETSLGN